MLIFSDMHFGIDRNSDKRIEDAMNVLKWIAEKAKFYGEKTCVFAGDWMHDRDEVDVKTAIKAKEGLKFISKSFEKFYLIAGNHDYYYNNSSEISSTSLFDDIDGIIVVKDKPEVIIENGKRILLAPWFYDPDNEVSHYDAMIGHFEFIGGKMNGGFSKIGYHQESMLSVAPLVFSGHYHLSSDIEKDIGKIIVIGSPYEQDWGDYGNPKRIIRFDGINWKNIYNDVSPKFCKLKYSKLASLKEDDLMKLFSNDTLKNGFIKIVSDTENGNAEEINKILLIGSSCNVRKIEADYSNIQATLNESIDSDVKDIANKDVKTYIHDFIDNCIMNDPMFSGISAEKSHKLVDNYFGKINGAKTK